MRQDQVDIIIESYSRLKNLKLVEKETGIRWQTVYWHLKKNGIEVTGDKARYGSASDRVAVVGEQEFQRTVPFATDNNKLKFQASIDFSIGDVTIDVKTALIKPGGRTKSGKHFASRWCYCINKQKDVADYFVLYAYEKIDSETSHIFLIPREIATNSKIISIPKTLKSKWADYQVSSNELLKFFELVRKDQAA